MYRFALRAQRCSNLGLVPRRSLSHFKIIEHVVPCQHTRHYLEGLKPNPEHDLSLAVKQYVPRVNHRSETNNHELTLIGAHANGFPKEVYEPIWDDLYDRLVAKGVKLKSIWVADIATQGQSGVLNESILGTDPSWWDHARDLLFLINQKQKDMPQPLIGIGHSVGASHLTALSLLHPRLFQALVLIDPVIQMENPSMTFAPPSTYRRDIWPSRDDAAAAFRKSKFYQKWDPRVLDKWIEYGLRELPTELYPEVQTSEDSKTPVTLTTTKAQEVFQYLRPLYKGDPWTDKDIYADFDPQVLKENEHFYRPEPREIFQRLPEILPTTRYIFGAQSELAIPELRRKKMHTTGSGFGGNGGITANRVTDTILDCGHLVPMEKTKDCANVAADFIDQEYRHWISRRQKLESYWKAKDGRDKIDIDDNWKQHIGPPPERSKQANLSIQPPSTDASKSP